MFWHKKNKKEQTPFLGGENEDVTEILAVFSYLADGLLVFDRNNRLSLINPQAEGLLEIKKEGVIGKSILELNPFPRFRPLVSLLGGDIKEYSKKEIDIGGSLVMEISVTPMMADQDKIGTIVVLRDITREKLIEAMKSEFVTLAAHQLRTPASGIKWSLRALLDGDMGEISEEQKKIIEQSYNTNEKVIQLINDLLNVARIEEGKFLSKITLSNIEEVIQSVIELYSDEVKRRKLKLIFKKPEKGLPKLMLDVEKIKMAIGNLVDNAIRYTLPGGKIIISLIKKDKEVEVQIQDTGLGIPSDQQEKVFSKFFRAENVMKVETEGTGLGLFIAKYIIEAHDGRIWFESEEGEGTIFYFTLPTKEQFTEYITPEFY